MKRCVVALLALALSACATGSGSGTYTGQISITKETWAYYEQYLRDIGTTSAGAFAVSGDGRSAYYFYCPDIACINRANYKQRALKGCAAFASDCVIFAYGREIVVAYKVEE
jgi:hypothetical protein